MGVGKKIAIGCGVLLLAFAVFIGAIVGFVWWATAGPEEAVRNFLAAAAAGEYENAHDYFSAPLKEEQSQSRRDGDGKALWISDVGSRDHTAGVVPTGEGRRRLEADRLPLGS